MDGQGCDDAYLQSERVLEAGIGERIGQHLHDNAVQVRWGRRI